MAVIPARGGSKGVRKKNIRALNGKPLIAYSIECALKVKKIDRLIVSSDDQEIIEVSKAFGADAPFKRPEKLARDDTPDRPVVIHAVKWMNDREYFPDVIVLLRPTTPLRTPDLVDQAITMMESTGADSVRTVTEVEGVHHPYWMFRKDDGGKPEPFVSGIKIEEFYQRQLLPKAYRLNGLVDCMKTDIVLKNQKQYGDDMRLLEAPVETSIDIDSEFDLSVCEAILKAKWNGLESGKLFKQL
ncbi:MAG: cytidylyltransferase domain-containing protein [Nitrospinota bacterium]